MKQLLLALIVSTPLVAGEVATVQQTPTVVAAPCNTPTQVMSVPGSVQQMAPEIRTETIQVPATVRTEVRRTIEMPDVQLQSAPVPASSVQYSPPVNYTPQATYIPTQTVLMEPERPRLCSRLLSRIRDRKTNRTRSYGIVAY